MSNVKYENQKHRSCIVCFDECAVKYIEQRTQTQGKPNLKKTNHMPGESERAWLKPPAHIAEEQPAGVNHWCTSCLRNGALLYVKKVVLEVHRCLLCLPKDQTHLKLHARSFVHTAHIRTGAQCASIGIHVRQSNLEVLSNLMMLSPACAACLRNNKTHSDCSILFSISG